MGTEIAVYKGYRIVYERREKLFHLIAVDNESVASAKSQEELEGMADKMVKLSFPFPIQAFHASGWRLSPGKVTSLNPDDRSMRFSFDDKRWRSTTKVHFTYALSTSVYEATEANRAIAARLDGKEAQVTALEEEMTQLISQLEKPMNKEYFKLEK